MAAVYIVEMNQLIGGILNVHKLTNRVAVHSKWIISHQLDEYKLCHTLRVRNTELHFGIVLEYRMKQMK